MNGLNYISWLEGLMHGLLLTFRKSVLHSLLAQRPIHPHVFLLREWIEAISDHQIIDLRPFLAF